MQQLEYTNDKPWIWKCRAFLSICRFYHVTLIYIVQNQKSKGDLQSTQHTNPLSSDPDYICMPKKQKIVKKTLLIGEKGRNLRNSDRRGISLPEWTCTRCVIVPSQVVSQSCWWLTPILMIVGPNSIWMLFLLALHWGQFTSPCIIARDWNAAPLMFIVIRPCGMWMLTQKCSQLVKSSAVWPSWESGSPTHPNLKQRSSETTTFSTDLLVCS